MTKLLAGALPESLTLFWLTTEPLAGDVILKLGSESGLTVGMAVAVAPVGTAGGGVGVVMGGAG